MYINVLIEVIMIYYLNLNCTLEIYSLLDYFLSSACRSFHSFFIKLLQINTVISFNLQTPSNNWHDNKRKIHSLYLSNMFLLLNPIYLKCYWQVINSYIFNKIYKYKNNCKYTTLENVFSFNVFSRVWWVYI